MPQVYLTYERVHDTDALQAFTSMFPDELALRLFLVEDMTAPIVEILGSAFQCQPDLFQHHMHSIGTVVTAGKPSPGGIIYATEHELRGRLQPPSGLRRHSFFSIPFRRKLATKRNFHDSMVYQN